VWRRYLGKVGKFIPHFVAYLSKTLHINFYQNRSSIVEVMTKQFSCVFLCPQFCSVELNSNELISVGSYIKQVMNSIRLESFSVAVFLKADSEQTSTLTDTTAFINNKY